VAPPDWFSGELGRFRQSRTGFRRIGGRIGTIDGRGRVRTIAGPISPAPVTHWRPEYLPAYVSNGLIGMRVGHIPLLGGVAMVSGFEGLDPDTGVEAFARAPYPLAGDVRIGRAALSDPQRAVLREQRYDFSCGELHSRLDFEGDDARAEVEIMTLCSRTHPTLALQEVRLRVDRDCELTMSAGVDARGVPGSWADHEVSGLAAPVDGMFRWRSFGELSSCGAAYATEILGTERFHRTCDRSRTGPLTTTYSFQASPGHEYRLRQLTSLVPQAVHSQPHLQAVRLVTSGQLHGFDALRQENRADWAELWRGRVVLAGAPARWQALADAAFFYLQSSVHGFSPSSTSVFGLAYWPNYHYDRGHLLWDIETFAMPPLLLTHPDAARALLRYRGSRLPAACANASLVNYPGAKYPWESSLRHGHEAAPVDTQGPATEHHVGSDVAIAFARYLHATGDRAFARDAAWPVLSAVAEWIAARVERTPRGYEIRGATGIAETGTTVDNSVFVNMAAALALREAAALGRDLARPYPQSWETIAAEVVIPIDAQTGVILNHDGYDPDENKGETPEAPAGLFPLGFRTDPDTERRTLEFYLRFADKYAGAPMLSAMLGVYGARLGDRAASLDLFEKGYADFVIDPYTITAEFSPNAFPSQPRAGPFTANLGGFLTSCLYGLTGLRLHAGDPASWFDRRIVLPKGWDAIEVDRVWVRGRPAALRAAQDDDRAHLVFG
jgi:protein-glucosylgalactosylhydroxylysine glucosidase